MRKRTCKATLASAALAAALTLQPPAEALAQAARGESGGTVAISNQAGRVQIRLERGSRVAISNRYGRITITGWDRDTVEATATSAKGAEAVNVEMTADPQARSTLALAVVGRGRRDSLFGAAPFVFANPTVAPRVYANPSTTPPAQPPQPAQPAARAGSVSPPREQGKEKEKDKVKPSKDGGSNVVIMPPPQAAAARPNAAAGGSAPRAASAGSRVGGGGGAGAGGGSANDGITLDVKVPRYAELDVIEVRSGDLNVSDLDGPVSIASGSSNITVRRVGALEVRARSGNINIEEVGGLVYVSASSGDITVRNSNGDVRATSINGDISVQCVRGRVDASNARGKIILNNVGGDVDVNTTSSDINFTGSLRAGGRYHLKSMEGRVTMSVPAASPGFTAVLSSYNSDVVTDFAVRSESTAPGMRVNRRVEVRQGDGQAQITMDSFSQAVQLTKATQPPPACR